MLSDSFFILSTRIVALVLAPTLIFSSSPQFKFSPHSSPSSDRCSEGTMQSVSRHLSCQEQGVRGGGDPAASEPEPRAAFKGEGGGFGGREKRSGGGRGGEGKRLLVPSVHVFCIPALIFTQREAGVLSVLMKGEVPFGGEMHSHKWAE